jgi:hypothetical protein
VASGFGWSERVVQQILREDASATRWDRLRTAVPPAAYFWYRESPVSLVPTGGAGRTGSFNPPMTRAGMTFVRLDPAGHLSVFMGVPPEYSETTGPWHEPEWPTLFRLAGLQASDFTPTPPRWTPPDVPSDLQRAWVKGTLRVEAASFHGRAVWFEVIPQWRVADTGAPAPTPLALHVGEGVLVAFTFLLLVAAALLARRNIRLGRGNPDGAFRLAVAYAAAGTLADLLTTSTSLDAFLNGFYVNLAWQLFLAVMVWLGYMAIEPYVRRLWPHSLIAWQRMLEGRFRDPLVGRHLLVGAMAGVVVSLIKLLPHTMRWLGLPPAIPPPVGLDALGGVEHLLAAYASLLQTSLFAPVALLLGFLVLRAFFRRPWIAALVLVTLLPGTVLLVGAPAQQVLPIAVSFGLGLFILTRWGLFAMLTTVVFSSWGAFPLTLDPSSWYFPWSVGTMLLFAGMAVYGFVVSLAGQPLLSGPFLDLDRDERDARGAVAG